MRALGENGTNIRDAGSRHHWILRNESKDWKRVLEKNKKLLETTLYSRNLIKGINISTVSLIRYTRRFIEWTKEEFRSLNQRMRKLMTMHNALLCEKEQRRNRNDKRRRLHRKHKTLGKIHKLEHRKIDHHKQRYHKKKKHTIQKTMKLKDKKRTVGREKVTWMI